MCPDPKKKLKIAVASINDPRSVNTWSGIPAHIIEELERQQYDVISIDLSEPNDPWYYHWLRSFYWRLFKKWFLSSVEKKYLKYLGCQLDEKVKAANPDIVLAIHGDLIAYSTFQHPVCFVDDTTFASIVDYYSCFTDLSTRSILAGNKMYARALQRTDAAIFASDWASVSAKQYEKGISKVHTIPFGANLKQTPTREEVAGWNTERVESDYCNFLFLGADWDRKGGPFALQIIAELNQIGLKSRLTVVGCEPEIPGEYKAYVKIMGFLNKSTPSDLNLLNALFIESHALILPSLAECYGCVFCEANAYGLPALGRNTGGIPEIIKEGVNGLLVKVGESPSEFAGRWATIWRDKVQYEGMLQHSRREFEKRLNYEVFIKKLTSIFDAILK